MSSLNRGVRRSRWALALALVLGVTACGSAVPHEQVLREAGVAPESVAGTGTDSGAHTDTGTSTVTDPSGGAVAAPVSGLDPAAPQPGKGTATTAAPKPGKANAGTAGSPATGTAPQPAGPATGSPVVIGQVGNFSGVPGQIEGQGQVGLKIWVNYANQHGGLNGHKIVLYSANDGGDPNKALAIVRDQVENKGAIAIVGAFMALSGQGIKSFVEQKQIPVVGGDVLSPPWSSSPLFFSSGTNMLGLAYGLTHIAAISDARKAALLYCVEAAVCSQFKNHVTTDPNWAKQQGVDLVYTSGVSLTQPSFASQCQAAQSAGAQSILAALEGPSLERLAQSCDSLGYHPKLIASALALKTTQEGNKLLEGLQAPAPDVPWMITSTPATKLFNEAVSTYAPGNPTGTFTMSGWVSGMMLQKALSTEITDAAAPVTTAQVLQGLWKFKKETLNGLAPPLTFVKGGPHPLVKCAFLVRMVNGKFAAPLGTEQFCHP